MPVNGFDNVLAMDVHTVNTAATVSAETTWWDVVDAHLDHVWRYALSQGLLEPEAAAVCELAWLRLAQRWSPIGGHDSAEVRGWLEQTVRTEARGTRFRSMSTLVRLAPLTPERRLA